MAFFSAWFLANSWGMHFFRLSGESLRVKNQNQPWQQHKYPLTDFKEIVFETQGKGPNTLRVIKVNHKNKVYSAGTLRDKTWLKLKKSLEEKGIPVRNECI